MMTIQIFFIGCFLLVGSQWSVAFGASKTVLIAADTWCPYNCDQTSHEQGFMVDIAREVLSGQGYTVVYKNQSWTSALVDMGVGKIDAIIGAAATEAKDFVLAGEPLGENRTCFYTRSDDPFVYKTGIALSNRRIGVTSGYLYGGSIDTYVQEHRANYNLVQLVTGDKPLLQNIVKLKERRIDTLIENMVVMDLSMKKFQVAGIRLAGCDAPAPLYMAFSPKRSDAGRLALTINDGMRNLRKSGRLALILAKYGLVDWKTK